MKLQVLIVTKYKWRSMDKKLKEVANQMSNAQNFHGVNFTVEHRDVGKPTVKDGRITHAWFDNHISKDAKQRGFHDVVFLFSVTDGKRWKLDSDIRGTFLRDFDGIGEMWIRANENSVKRYGKKKVNEFVRVLLHEESHTTAQRLGIAKKNDLTHFFDYTLNDVGMIFKTYNWSRWNSLMRRHQTLQEYLIDLLTLLVDKLRKRAMNNNARTI